MMFNLIFYDYLKISNDIYVEFYKIIIRTFELYSKVKCTPKVRHKAFRGTL